MAEFTASVYQNEFLPDGGTDVNAIVTVTCTGAGAAGQSGAGDAGEIIIVDTSGSMGRTKIEAAKVGRRRGHRPDPRRHLVRRGRRHATSLPGVPARPVGRGHGADGPADPLRGAAGDRPVPLRRRYRDGHLADAGRSAVRLGPDAGPAARDPAHRRREPQRVRRAADQRDRRRSTGKFQCDCRGVGVDWQVAEVRRIAQALLGTVDIIPEPERWPRCSPTLMQQSMSRGVADAQLRVWAPQGAQVHVRPAGGARPSRT